MYRRYKSSNCPGELWRDVPQPNRRDERVKEQCLSRWRRAASAHGMELDWLPHALEKKRRCLVLPDLWRPLKWRTRETLLAVGTPMLEERIFWILSLSRHARRLAAFKHWSSVALRGGTNLKKNSRLFRSLSLSFSLFLSLSLSLSLSFTLFLSFSDVLLSVFAPWFLAS